MKNAFEVTGLGLKVDGIMIMPGSKLLLSAPAKSHWNRFGTSETKELTVATPNAKATAETAKTDKPATAAAKKPAKTAPKASG